MERRFTLVQGGLARDGVPRAGDLDPMRVVQVRLLRPLDIGPDEAAAWRGLVSRLPYPDPFADPDYLLTAALNAARDAGIVFAFAYGATRGREILRGVVPLTVPHPVWGGRSFRLWQPALAPHPVEPACEAGGQAEVMHALLRHLGGSRPRAGLRLCRLAAGSPLLAGLAADDRLTTAVYQRSAPVRTGTSAGSVPPASSGSPRGVTTETITARTGVRDAVERFLHADAEHASATLIARPETASIVRVVTRLFAQRDAVEVELDRRGPDIVGGAIRLGPAGARVSWLAVNRPASGDAAAQADLVIQLSEPAASSPPLAPVRARPRLVAS